MPGLKGAGVEALYATGADWLAFLRSEIKEPSMEGVMPEHIGRLLLEAPYRRQVAHEEVESLVGFCSDWIESVARSKQ